VDLPGVGSRIRERLLENYGSEENALDAVLKGDVEGLCKVLSERQAFSLVQSAKGLKYGCISDDFLATDEVLKIYRMLISRMASFACTEYARLKIGTLFPSFSGDHLAENRRMAEAALKNAKLLQESSPSEQLIKIKPLREKAPTRVRERALAATSVEAFQQLKARGLDKLIDLHLAQSPRELMDLAKSYSQVSLVGEDMEGPEGIDHADSLEEWYLVPECVLGFYSNNFEIILAAVEAAQKIENAGLAHFAGLGDMHKQILLLDQEGDFEAKRLSQLSSRLSLCINEVTSRANDELKKRIESSSITLGGMDLLQVMSRGEGIKDLFETQMKGVFQEVLKEAKARATRELDLAGSEAVWLDEIFSAEVCYPLELDREALHAFEQDLRSRIEKRGLKAKRELARRLEDKKELVAGLVHDLMEFDFSYALGRFFLEESLALPEMVEEPCLDFVGGRNLFLEEPDAVDYSLGTKEHSERVALLSGVNSGGKTSLLDLIAQIVILAHMGLPVPARACRVGLFQEMYYFSKSRGTLSAGAFETAIRKFSVVENQKRKLVLADELESITEPGASARIIACMLDELNRREGVAVFVSHLAEEVLRYAETPVRVDGIEASGLDEENRLMVNRSPRYNFLARSTPELILDRLVRSSDGPEKEFYARLLAKFG